EGGLLDRDEEPRGAGVGGGGVRSGWSPGFGARTYTYSTFLDSSPLVSVARRTWVRVKAASLRSSLRTSPCTAFHPPASVMPPATQGLSRMAKGASIRRSPAWTPRKRASTKSKFLAATVRRAAE